MLCRKSFILYSCNKIKENHSLKQTYFLHFSQLYMLSPVKKNNGEQWDGINYHINWIFSLKGNSLKLWNRRLFIVRVQNTLKRRPRRLLKCKILSKKFEQNFRTPSLQWCYLELLWRISNQCRRCYYICNYETLLYIKRIWLITEIGCSKILEICEQNWQQTDIIKMRTLSLGPNRQHTMYTKCNHN